MNENETTALVKAFDRAYINGKFVTPHGTQVVDLVNPTDNTVIGKVTMAEVLVAVAKGAKMAGPPSSNVRPPFPSFQSSCNGPRRQGFASSRPITARP